MTFAPKGGIQGHLVWNAKPQLTGAPFCLCSGFSGEFSKYPREVSCFFIVLFTPGQSGWKLCQSLGDMTWAIQGLGTGNNLYEKTWFLTSALWGRLWKWSGLSELSRESKGAWNQGSQLWKPVLSPEPMGQHESPNIFRSSSLCYIYLSLLETFLLKFRQSALLPGNRQVMILSLLLLSPFKTHGYLHQE